MSEKPISPLRRRMIEDMSVRNFVEKTRNEYIRHVRTFTAFLGRSPDTATPEDLRRFQLHQTQTGVRAPSINGSVAALRFFFTVVREPRKIPVILSPEEVARLLAAAPGPKYKAALSAAGSIPHDNEHWIATAQGRLRLPPVRNRLRVRSPKCAEPPSKQASNNRPQRPSPPSNRATIAHQSRHCSRPDALPSVACTLRVSKIPIAGRAAPPRTIARGFVLWRLSDAGHRALGFSCIAGIRNPAQKRKSARSWVGQGVCADIKSSGSRHRP
jgi:hypothetical protein